MRIQKGRFRGRLIEAPPGIRGHQEFTPGLVKEALFQRIENLAGDLSEWNFYDLCAGSGQIAFEAASRGFAEIHACEIDQGRFGFLLDQVRRHSYPVRCHRKDFQRLARSIAGSAVVFLDLPYSFWTPLPEAVPVFLEALSLADYDRVLFFLQGPDCYPGFECVKYGSTSLSWTSRADIKNLTP